MNKTMWRGLEIGCDYAGVNHDYVDFEAVAASGQLDFVMLRTPTMTLTLNGVEPERAVNEQQMRRFKMFRVCSEAAGIPYGIFFPSFANNAKDASDLSEAILRFVDGIGAIPEYPIAFHVGYKRTNGALLPELAEAAATVAERIRAEGMSPIIQFETAHNSTAYRDHPERRSDEERVIVNPMLKQYEKWIFEQWFGSLGKDHPYADKSEYTMFISPNCITLTAVPGIPRLPSNDRLSGREQHFIQAFKDYTARG